MDSSRAYHSRMPPWVCPKCERSFGRRNQSHTCAPGTTLDASFEGRPEGHRAICDTIIEHLESLGPVVVEPVDVGVFFKRSGTFGDLRHMKSRMRLMLLVSAHWESPRIVREVEVSANRMAYFIDIRDVSEVDAELRDWITEAYFTAPE